MAQDDRDHCPVVKVPFMKRAAARGRIRGRDQNKRPRITEGGDSDSEESDTQVIIPASYSKQTRTGITACTIPGHVRATISSSVRATNSQLSNSDSDENEPAVSSYRSRRTAESAVPKDMGATSELLTETEHGLDHQALHQKSIQLNRETGETEGGQEVYRGINNYKKIIEPRDTARGNASSGSVRKGPVRAPLYLRSTVRWDYQPDICKDYKETGTCGFGDSCKFLHDRSDYKFGWQLEREENERVREIGEDKVGVDDNFEVSSEDDGLPFACLICRERFTNPIVTKCKHYFCEACALKRYKKNKRCYVCGVQTNGMFTPAKQLLAKIEKKINSAKDKHGVCYDSD